MSIPTKTISFLCVPLCVLSGALAAAPYTPTDANVVLQTVDPSAGLRRLRARQAAAPEDSASAAALVEAYLLRARHSGDPRYLGYAQSALSPWWSAPVAADDILVLRAMVKQANHDFTAALADLDLVIRRNPAQVQAWLTRASIQQVRGDYAGARQSCRRLLRLRERLLAQGCLAGIASLTGQAAPAYRLLSHLSAESAGLNAGTTQWLQGLLAEIALRRNDFDAAERHFRTALASAPPDTYLLAAFADALLDAGRPQAVIALLQERTQADTLLLRLAIAERQLQDPHAQTHIGQLRDSFAASHARGDNRHQREQALFHLKLLQEPRAALRLATANWQLQHEPLDARILLEAALAAGDAQAATPVLKWMQESGIEDPQLTRLRDLLSAVRT